MIIEHVRRTKIICSYDSTSLNKDLAEEISKEEFDILRVVYDAGPTDQICDFLKVFKKIRQQAGFETATMLDVSPRVRAVVGQLAEPIELNYQDIIRITPPEGDGEIKAECVDWQKFFKADTQLYLGFGNLVLNVQKVSKNVVEAEVAQGGLLQSGMDMHIPATRPEPHMELFDQKELKKLLSCDFDHVVFPGFVAEDEIQRMKDLCKSCCKQEPWYYLKLNCEKVHKNLETLIDSFHGVFISRMELALFIDPAMVPIISKEVTQLCSDKAKVVMIASEMLGSMRHNATPTRAEVSDIANAVCDGADAVVLTEEVGFGRHSVRAINLMRKIIEDVEEEKGIQSNWSRHDPAIEEEMDAVAFSAYKTAQRVGAKAIVCLTKEGNTALKLSSFRFSQPILAVTFSGHVLNKLKVVRGVDGVLLDGEPIFDDVLPRVNDLLLQHSWLENGDKIVFVSVTLSPLGRQESNLFTIQTLEGSNRV